MADSLLYYEVHGTKGPFLLLVHGILSSRAQWIPNIEALSEFSRPVVIELLGHGRSPSPEDIEFYTPEGYIHQFELIRQTLGAESWFICGQSLGASLTLRYALQHPDRITAQVFTNSRSALSETTSGEVSEMLAKRLKEQGRDLIDKFPLHPSRSRNLPAEIKKALIDDSKLIEVNGFINTMFNTAGKSSVRETLPKNTVPTLMIVGKYDKQFAPLVEVAQQVIPGLETLILEGGHAVNIGAAEEFNSAVKAFYTRFI